MHKKQLLQALIQEESLYDTKQKLLYIPDISGNPYRIYGIMIANLSGLTKKEMKNIIQEEKSLTSYAINYIPAPNASGPDNLGFYPLDSDYTNDNQEDTSKEIKTKYTKWLSSYFKKDEILHLIPEAEYIKKLTV